MNPDLSIDWASLRSYVGWIAGQRPSAIVMNMDASEGLVGAILDGRQPKGAEACRAAG
jgi:hypothetical protein